MTKLTLSNVANFQNESSAVTTLASNNAATILAVENTLSRDGTLPNHMNADFDMNSNRIINLPDALTDQEPATFGQLEDRIGALEAGAVLQADFVTLGNSPLLTNERVLTEGNLIDITDGGPDSIVTIAVDSDSMNSQVGTLTNKTIDLASNTVTGTRAQFNTALSDDNFSTLTGVETLTNKTLTNPTVTTGTFTSPTLVTPALGTPTSGTLTNATGLPISTGVSGLGTGVSTALGVNVGTAGSPVVNGGALGTPSSGTLTNATGLPVSTGVSGLGTGVATFLATPSSANLRTALTDEVGTGGAYFVGGALGTPASGTATNITGLPISTGVSGLGTGVATFLATPSSANLRTALTDEVGTGSAYFTGGALGTPASGTGTNLTGIPLSAHTTQAAYTFVGNNSGSTAVPTAVDIAGLTTKGSPAAGDYVILSDQAASGAWKKATVSSVGASSGVTSLNGLTGAVTLASTDFDNKFRNGNFCVWQRGTALTNVTNAYTADGWIVSATGAAVGGVSQATATRSGALTAHQMTIVGATSVTGLIVKQRIEGFMAMPLAGQSVTVQLQVFNNTGGSITPTYTVRHANATDNWGATTTDVSAVSLQACANSAWTQVSATFTAHASSGNGLEIEFNFGNNFSTSGKSVSLAEADIRRGTAVAAPSFRNYPEELLNCQRYYWRLNATTASNYIFMAQCYSTSAAWGSIGILPTTMRTSPTVSISNAGHLSGTNSAGVSVAFTGVAFSANSNSPQVVGTNNLTGASGLAAGNACIVSFNNASAWIDATAEL